jgi:NADP-dependent 3-hydroxy acid dehydrogenase YdfG
MTAIDTDVNAVKRMFEVNVFGPMQMVHHFHDMLIRAAGTIVNIGSIGGVVPYMYGGMLTSSKSISEDHMLTSSKRPTMRQKLLFIIILIHCVLRCHHSSKA